MMRGYRLLRDTNQLGKITAVKDAIANTPLNGCALRPSSLIFGSALGNAERAVRQYLLVRLASVNLNKALLRALGKRDSAIVYPLPLEWRRVVREHGFKVGEFGSALAWNSYIVLHLAYGAVAIAKRVRECIIETARPSVENLSRYVFFHGLSRGNLPATVRREASHDIVSWYLQWAGRVPEVDTVCHTVRDVPAFELDGVSVVPLRSAIQPFARGAPLVRYVFWGLTALLTASVDLFLGRWWHALLLNEASLSALMRHHGPGHVAREYLFPNMMWVYRPLWTYEAEKQGSRITFYFYSTHSETFKTPEGYPLQENFWQAMSWPYYLVWDQYQADFIRRAVGENANISVVGPVWFQANTQELPPLPSGSVAVFDVEPHRPSRYQVLGMSQEYFVAETATRFLVDIHEAVSKCGGTVVLKRKRPVGKLRNRKYTRVVEELRASDHFVAIDPETAAVRVIENCIAVISMPFTSTALLGRHLGKPSVYYDPSGVVQKDDRAAHGIETLSGPGELQTWVRSIILAKTGHVAHAQRPALANANGPTSSQEPRAKNIGQC